jgi:hypothetical protein
MKRGNGSLQYRNRISEVFQLRYAPVITIPYRNPCPGKFLVANDNQIFPRMVNFTVMPCVREKSLTLFT